MFLANDVEKLRTHISFSVTFFFENRAVYEIVWRNMVVSDGPHVIMYE